MTVFRLSGSGARPMKSTEKAVSAKKRCCQRGGAVSVSRSSSSKLRQISGFLLGILAGVCFSTNSENLRGSAVQTTKFLTVQETLALYGNTITASVYDNGSYRNVNFTYLGEHPTNSAGLRGLVPSGSTEFTNWPCLEYVCSDVGTVSLQADTVTVYLNPQYSVFDTTSFSTLVGLSTNTDISTSVYNDSAWDFISPSLGSQTFYSPSADSRYNYSGATNEYYAGDNNCVWIPVDIQEQNTFQISSVECRFRGNSGRYDGSGSVMYLHVGCPRVDDVSSYSSGVYTETTVSTSGGGSGGDTYVTVIVNNEEIVSALDEQNAQNSEYQDKMINGDPEAVTTIASMDSSIQSGFEGALTGDDLENAIYTDIPNVIASAGFWVSILGRILTIIPIIKVIFAPAILLSLLAYILWRK